MVYKANITFAECMKVIPIKGREDLLDVLSLYYTIYMHSNLEGIIF